MDAHSPSRKSQSPSAISDRLGLVSLLLGSGALVSASVPYLRVLALPLSGLGVSLGIWALTSAQRRKSVRTLPLAGAAVSLVVFLLAGFWLNQFETLFGSWRKQPVIEQKTVPVTSQVNRSSAAASPSDWVDASRDAVQLRDVRVRLVSVKIGSVELMDSKGKVRPSEKCLILKVRVSNAGAERVVQFRSWYQPASLPEKGVPLLHNNQGKLYSLKAFPANVEVMGRVTEASLPPSKKVEDVLIFEARPERVEFLRLQLPASAFGSPGIVRMQIPGPMIISR
jgi:hypothetical protein